MHYYGVTNNPKNRWSTNGEKYKETSLYPYIEKFGWDNIKHIILFENQSKEDALKIEDSLIISGWEKGNCINKNRSGNIKKEDWYIKKLHKNYYNKNKDRIQEKHRQYQRENREKTLEYQREYYEQNRDEILEQKRGHYQQNREKILEYQREYNEKNREKILEYQQEYYEQNKDKIREQKKQYREQNREKIREYNRQYYQRKKLEKQLKEVETTPLF